MDSRLLIAAPSSGSGKTIFSIGLMRVLSQRGLKVAPFKSGPDYIDTQFHRVASGRESLNLDLFMSSEEHVKQIFTHHSYGVDVSIVEGAMGMFDGYETWHGSCADVARTLQIPVVLVINAASTAYSVAATIHGFSHFMPQVRVVGVVLNRVASERHYEMLLSACHDIGTECLGYMALERPIEIPSRHLGLTLSTLQVMNDLAEKAAEIVKAHVDVDRLLELTAYEPETEDIIKPCLNNRTKMCIAVARDEAFSFIYPANIEAWQNHPKYEVDIKWFSPLHDKEMPTDVDLLYLPGGYPELYAEQLENNKTMRQSIADYIEKGGRTLAECGGLMYVGNKIDEHEMVGALPLTSTMGNGKLILGYRQLELMGLKLRGHEFHYSRMLNPNQFPSAARQFNATGKEACTPIYHMKNLFASYTHLYWGETDILKLWE